MRFIVVDTADARGSVALFEGIELRFIEVHSTAEDYSSWLLAAVNRVLANSSLSLSELDGYAVCAGPGSFTGLRVGLTTVKAWAEIYDKPIAALSRLEALAGNDSRTDQALVASYLDARREQAFAALYVPAGDGFALFGEELVISLPDFVAQVKDQTKGRSVRWVTPDAKMLESLLEWPLLAASGHTLEEVSPPFAQRLAFLAYRKFLRGDTTDGLSLDANYLRRSDAEVFWKGHKSAVRA